MVESHDGKGVLIFGGVSKCCGYDTHYENRILELHVGSNSWNILNITLNNRRCQHVVIPFQ